MYVEQEEQGGLFLQDQQLCGLFLMLLLVVYYVHYLFILFIYVI